MMEFAEQVKYQNPRSAATAKRFRPYAMYLEAKKKDQSLHIGVSLFIKKLFWSCDIVDMHETKNCS